MCCYELLDRIVFLYPIVKVKMIKEALDAPFLGIYRIQTALILVAIEILLGQFTYFGASLPKRDYLTALMTLRLSNILLQSQECNRR